MPAGVSVGQYLRFVFAALASMAAGSQTVHTIYKPLEDMDRYVNHEIQIYPQDIQKHVAQKLEVK